MKPSILLTLVAWISIAGPVMGGARRGAALATEDCARKQAGSILLVGGRVVSFESSNTTVFGGMSQYCLSCHDGTVGSGVVRRTLGKSSRRSILAVNRPGGHSSIHPVDMPYPDGDRRYVAAALLDLRIELTQGQVTCASCHQLGSEDLVAVPMDRSGLCLSCHLK